MIDLLPSEEQQQIIDSVVAYLEENMPLARLRPGPDGGMPQGARIADAQWRDMAALGWFGLGVSEASGGADCAVVGEMLVARELGRYAASPSIVATMTAAHLAARAGSDLFQRITRGELRIAFANRLHADGEVYHLIDAQEAEYFLVADETAAALYPAAAFADARPVVALDDSITLERARLAPSARPLLEEPGSGIARHVSLLNCAQLLGVAAGAMTLAVEYAKVREQFGQAIGAFQALKHRCADMAVLAEAAYAQTYLAGLAQAGGEPDAGRQIAAARLVSADAALSNARSCIQIHGGIGFTAECAAHVFLKRAHLLGRLGGDSRSIREALLARLP